MPINITSEGNSRKDSKTKAKDQYKQRKTKDLEVELYQDDIEFLERYADQVDLTVSELVSRALEGAIITGEIAELLPYGVKSRRDVKNERTE